LVEAGIIPIESGPLAHFLFVMPQKRSLELENLLGPTVHELGYELLGVEYLPQGRHSVLRLYIDRPEGITIDDCEHVSREVSALLDVEDPIRGEYHLEVSSPGADRPLFRPQHYRRFRGRLCKLRLSEPVEGRRNYRGVIEDADEEHLCLKVDGETVSLPFALVEKANLVPEW